MSAAGAAPALASPAADNALNSKLMKAAATGDVEAVEELIRQGADAAFQVSCSDRIHVGSGRLKSEFEPEPGCFCGCSVPCSL